MPASNPAMASFQILSPSLTLPRLKFFLPLFMQPSASVSQGLEPPRSKKFIQSLKLHCSVKPNPTRASANGDANGAVKSKKPTRRGRKKGSASSSTPATPTKKTKRSRKSQVDNGTVAAEPSAKHNPDTELEDYDDGIDFPYDDPPLICCFGSVQKEFVPTVRVSDNPMHPDIYSQWKMLQWDPPEFVRAPGGPPSNVAISHVRLGGRAAFMGKVGDDDFGDELVLMMNKEKVQTRAVKFDSNAKTACSYMKIKFENGKMRTEMVKESAEDSLLSSELNLAVLKEVLH